MHSKSIKITKAASMFDGISALSFMIPDFLKKNRSDCKISVNVLFIQKLDMVNITIILSSMGKIFYFQV